MMNTFTFLSPEWLPLIILPLLWLMLQKKLSHQRRGDLKGFCEIGSRPWLEVQKSQRGKNKRNIIIFLAQCLTMVACLRPAWNPHPVTMSEEGRDLIFVLDVSKSMLAQDCRPDRLTQAKQAIQQAIGAIPSDRHALLAFAGSPSIRSPLTEDRTFMLKALDETTPESVSQGGTRIEDALYKVVDKLVYDKNKNSTDIFLITDGDDLGNLPQKSIDLINQLGLRVVIIGLGDAQRGARIPSRDVEGKSQYIQYKGREVWSKHRPDYLQQLCDRFQHGLYFNIGRESLNLKLMISQLRLKWQGESRAVGEKMIYTEGSWYFFMLSFLLLSWGLGFPSKRLGSVLLVLVFIQLGVPSMDLKAEDLPTDPMTEQAQKVTQTLIDAQQQKLDFQSTWKLAQHYMDDCAPEAAARTFLEAVQYAKGAEQAVSAHFNAGISWIQLAKFTEKIPMKVITQMIENEEEPIPASTYYLMAMDSFRLILRHDPHHTRSSQLLTWCHKQVYQDGEQVEQDQNQNDQNQESSEVSQDQDQQASDQQQSEEGEQQQESQQQSESTSDKNMEGSHSMSSAELQLPPPAANPQDLLRMQEESQLVRQKSSSKNASKVEKDW